MKYLGTRHFKLSDEENSIYQDRRKHWKAVGPLVCSNKRLKRENSFLKYGFSEFSERNKRLQDERNFLAHELSKSTLNYEKLISELKHQLENSISYKIKKFFKKSKDRFLSVVHTDLLALRDMICVWEA